MKIKWKCNDNQWKSMRIIANAMKYNEKRIENNENEIKMQWTCNKNAMKYNENQ